ncbi:hypothetical protein H0A36_25705 [Endozoicomonas sp. SM1973]|uniref:Uncharacterized protein n=1 Tax=Spartinivicinus marinus TaxID=2994442 RepID=A0A853IK08_9GAMM|nr:hypothetical protein [Spartinivicinus marinus]MCX4030371.1 hypothetical protein [Spartinivicinus marinus]MCX4030459.1 hypothetical protein [Spartinivicinus marinus]NYZ69415.1 hypothetical protein [Spartinivicinus marinus]
MPCYHLNEGGIICGELGPHCSDCLDVCEYLCDFPVGKGKTCDRRLCTTHAHEVGIDLHYCSNHLSEWQHFVESGGVIKAVLENIKPFKK